MRIKQRKSSKMQQRDCLQAPGKSHPNKTVSKTIKTNKWKEY